MKKVPASLIAAAIGLSAAVAPIAAHAQTIQPPQPDVPSSPIAGYRVVFTAPTSDSTVAQPYVVPTNTFVAPPGPDYGADPALGIDLGPSDANGDGGGGTDAGPIL